MHKYDHRGGTVRVTVTVPPDVVESADRCAAEESRSRSWVFTEAVAQYTTRRDREWTGVASPENRQRPELAREGATALFQQASLDRLRSDLALSPDERVREMESILRASETLHPRSRAYEIVAFETWEDYLDWKRREWGR